MCLLLSIDNHTDLASDPFAKFVSSDLLPKPPPGYVYLGDRVKKQVLVEKPPLKAKKLKKIVHEKKEDVYPVRTLSLLESVEHKVLPLLSEFEDALREMELLKRIYEQDALRALHDWILGETLRQRFEFSDEEMVIVLLAAKNR